MPPVQVIDQHGELITIVARNSTGEISRFKAYGSRRRTVAVFAANRQLGEGYGAVAPVRTGNWISSTTVTKDASFQDGAAKTIVGEFVAR